MKSWRLAAISLIPNLIPLLLVAGFMGAAGIPLKVATSLIFTIVYGIAVDDTIHFLNSYRLNCKLYRDPEEAVQQTISDMWRPMLFTTIVLISGFMIFLLSEFSSISNLGLLISGSLVAALLTDLFLLPVLLTKLTWKPRTIKQAQIRVGRAIGSKDQESPKRLPRVYGDNVM
jgi:predicted RND superfamily exporter protein